MLSFALISILNVVACKVSKHGIDFSLCHSSIHFTAILFLLPWNTLNDSLLMGFILWNNKKRCHAEFCTNKHFECGSLQSIEAWHWFHCHSSINFTAFYFFCRETLWSTEAYWVFVPLGTRYWYHRREKICAVEPIRHRRIQNGLWKQSISKPFRT